VEILAFLLATAESWASVTCSAPPDPHTLRRALPLLQVPRSSKEIEEDSDYSLFSVTLFRRVVENFKSEARQKGFQVLCFQALLVSNWSDSGVLFDNLQYSWNWEDPGVGRMKSCAGV